MPWYLLESSNSAFIAAEPMIQPDGTPTPQIPDRPSPQHWWENGQWVEKLVPQWEPFIATFQFPGNPLYSSILAKISASDFTIRDHWQNFKSLMMSQELRNTDAMAAGINHLADLLNQANQPLSADDKAGWNDLIAKFNFPSSCQLS